MVLHPRSFGRHTGTFQVPSLGLPLDKHVDRFLAFLLPVLRFSQKLKHEFKENPFVATGAGVGKVGFEMIPPVVASSEKLVTLVLWSEMEWASIRSFFQVNLLMSSQVLDSFESGGTDLGAVLRRVVAHVLFAVSRLWRLEINVAVVEDSPFLRWFGDFRPSLSTGTSSVLGQ